MCMCNCVLYLNSYIRDPHELLSDITYYRVRYHHLYTNTYRKQNQTIKLKDNFVVLILLANYYYRKLNFYNQIIIEEY